VTVNHLLILDVVLAISPVQEVITVSGSLALLETTISSSGATIPPQQIEQMPINGRNYLDLMQLIPGVTVNRQADAGTDAAAPILGERGGTPSSLLTACQTETRSMAAPQLLSIKTQFWSFKYSRRVTTQSSDTGRAE